MFEHKAGEKEYLPNRAECRMNECELFYSLGGMKCLIVIHDGTQ